jgi:hypothetical protein
MEGDVALKPFEERGPIANEDRQDRIPNFVNQPEAKTRTTKTCASNNPDGSELGAQSPIHELREIA